MAAKQSDIYFGAIERNIRQQARALGITLVDLAKQIDMTEAGFYKMLSTDSIKVKTLIKLSEVLKQPVAFFFEHHAIGSFSQNDAPAAGLGQPSAQNFNENEALKKQISLLESQLKDKEMIIELLRPKA